MGCRILHDRESDQAVLYCSTSDWAFGPVFTDSDTHDADERAEAFCRWLKRDARLLTDAEMHAEYAAWLAQEDAQWTEEERSAFEDAR